MSPSSSSRLLEWFVNLIKSSQNGVLGCIVYEMFGLEDAFGRVMINNLRVRVPDRYEVCNLTLIHFLGA
jgi:[phosphatase 2A protein]-leucine-carboxy methyltransferase